MYWFAVRYQKHKHCIIFEYDIGSNIPKIKRQSDNESGCRFVVWALLQMLVILTNNYAKPKH